MRRQAGAGQLRLEFIEPLMPTLVEKPPEGADWIPVAADQGLATLGRSLSAEESFAISCTPYAAPATGRQNSNIPSAWMF